MARSLSQALTRLPFHNHRHHHRLLALRTQSNQPSSTSTDDVFDSSATSDPALSRLEDAIHRIIARRSAPDWLPFVPGSSYWVPPPVRLNGISQLLEKLANPLSPDENMSTTTIRGWPSSSYFIQGDSPHPIEVETTSNKMPQPEEEEG